MKAARALLSAALLLALAAAGLELSLRGAGAFASWRRQNPRPAGDLTRVLCLGESTTFGAQVSYPAELEKLLNADGRRYQVVNGGVPGIDTDEILRRLDGNLERYRPRVVVAMMGANDPGTPWARALERAGGAGSWKAARLARLLASGFFRRPAPLDELARRERKADRMTALARRGAAALREGRLVRAAAYFLAARALGSETARQGLASCALSFGLRAAADRLSRTRGDLPDGDAYMEVAYGFEHEQRRVDAHRAVLKALEAFGERRRAFKRLESEFATRGLPGGAKVMANFAAFTRQTASRAYWVLGRTCRALKPDAACLPDFRRAVEESDAAGAEGAPSEFEDGRSDVPKGVFFTRSGSRTVRAETRLHLAAFLAELGRAGEALEAARASFELDPDDDDAASLLSRLLRARGRGKEAEAVLEKSLAREPEDPKRLLRLAVFEESYGRAEKAAELRERARIATESRGLTVTELNYRRLAQALAARGIPLVCAAYPRTRTDRLRGVLSGRSGVFFVDNERGFSEQIARGGVDSVFTDLFGGTFGHCTPLGYRILARNVEDGVLAALGTPREREVPAEATAARAKARERSSR